jgi:hypothetical protein
MTQILDPTGELSPVEREPLAKPSSIEGLTLGLLDISKPRGNIFLDRLEDLFVQRGAKVNRYSKPTFTRIAPTELKQRIAQECDIVVEALAD